MKGMPFMNAPGLYLEIGQSSLKALDGEDGLELSLERQENGRLTAPCAERLTLSLRVFLRRHNWRPRLQAFCALGARGVTLRRLRLPSSSREELDRLLPLQIESEFPLPPAELAWGYRPLSPQQVAGNGAPAVQELLVAAVKRDVIQEYADLLTGCGLSPVFTVAALARSSLCARPPASYAVLDIGRNHSELISFENGTPSSIRLLPWGGEHLTSAIEQRLAISRAEAEKLKAHLDDETVSKGGRPDQLQAAFGAELQALAQSLHANWIGQKLFLTGATAALKSLAPGLARALGGTVPCERLEMLPGEGRSAAILGLKKACEQNEGAPPLILQRTPSREAESAAHPAPWRWAALACLLLLASLSLRYAEPLFQKPRLARKLADIKAYRQALPKIERDLSFLLYLKTNQPPYLAPLFTVASAAPAGTRIETLSINRRGDLSLRAAMRDSQQVVDFRSKLIDSGLFAAVVVEEQTPTPDRQKILVRITGHWNLKGAEPPRPAPEKAHSPLNPAKLTNEQPPIIKTL